MFEGQARMELIFKLTGFPYRHSRASVIYALQHTEA